MLENKPLLSICIPTYNRADVLKICLETIVHNRGFCDDIEVVVCDNNSTDDTFLVMQSFVQNYNNIKYYRNVENIGFDNFAKVLELACGKFKKLHNDYSLFTSQGLEQLYSVIKLHEKTKPMILFGNWGKYDNVLKNHYYDLNSLVDYGRFALGWIGLYGYWEDDFVELRNKYLKRSTLFMHVDWFLRLFQKKKECYFYSSKYVERAEMKLPQGGYDFFDTHITKFLSIFYDYYLSNDLSQATWDRLNYNVFRYMLGWVDRLYILESRKQFAYETKSPFKLMFKTFGKYPWFYFRILKYIFHVLRLYIGKIKMK